MITLRDVILRRGTKVLLDKVSLTLNPGEKAGLVGRNGAGKSTLFALFDGSLHEDGGEFSRPAHWQMAQVAQNMPETDEPATDFVLAGDTRLMAVQGRLDQAEARLHEFPDDADAGMAVGQAHADLHDAGVHDAVPRAQALILGLGFTTEQLHRQRWVVHLGFLARQCLEHRCQKPQSLEQKDSHHLTRIQCRVHWRKLKHQSLRLQTS